MKRDLYVSKFRSPGGNEKTEELKTLFEGVKAMRPAVRFCPERDPFPEDPRIKAIRFSGLPDGDRETRVFAYIGFPENASAATPVPGMVLVHGGAGHAYAEWVQYWNDHGFAAISFDGFGQTYTGEDHTYEHALDLWKPDPLSQPPMDGFATAGKPFMEQGFTYYVADVLLANTILREDPRVKQEQIGLTGISWGGFASSVAVCYDSRFAFAAPVYCSGFMNASKTVWGRGFSGEGITDVWDAGLLLDTVRMPVRFFNSDCDPFTDVNATTASAAAVPDGSLTLLHGFTHGQIEGSSIPELLRFAEEQVGGGQRNIRIDALEEVNGGALLSYTLPADVTDAVACIYYKTEDLIYADKYLREDWRSETCVPRDGKAFLRIPEEAALFYFSVEGTVKGVSPAQTLHETTGVCYRDAWGQ